MYLSVYVVYEARMWAKTNEGGNFELRKYILEN